MRCECCGAELEKDALFCENCGTKVRIDETAKTPEREVKVQPDTSGVDVSAYPTAVQPPVGISAVSQTTPMPSVSEQRQDFVAPQPRAENKKPKKLVIIAIIASAVVLIAVVVLVVTLVFGGDESKDNESKRGYTSLKEQQLTESLENSKEEETPQSSSRMDELIESQYGYVLPDSDSRYYSESELNALTDYELYIARNEIYARHGRIFNNEDLMGYFGHKRWYYGKYSPESFDSIVTLNAYEKKNAEVMLSIEKRRGSSYLS